VDSDNPPEILKTQEMRQVMKVLHQFSENEKDYLLYQSRMDAVLKENTYLSELEEARQQVEQAMKEKEQLQAKFDDLLLLLKKKGIELDKE
jgi:hypothetical protein